MNLYPIKIRGIMLINVQLPSTRPLKVMRRKKAYVPQAVNTRPLSNAVDGRNLAKQYNKRMLTSGPNMNGCAAMYSNVKLTEYGSALLSSRWNRVDGKSFEICHKRCGISKRPAPTAIIQEDTFLRMPGFEITTNPI